jgi:hypothetical protein
MGNEKEELYQITPIVDNGVRNPEMQKTPRNLPQKRGLAGNQEEA